MLPCIRTAGTSICSALIGASECGRGEGSAALLVSARIPSDTAVSRARFSIDGRAVQRQHLASLYCCLMRVAVAIDGAFVRFRSGAVRAGNEVAWIGIRNDERDRMVR